LPTPPKSKASQLDRVGHIVADNISKQQTESTEVNGDECVLTRKTGERIVSLEDLIRVCKIDTTIWEVERYVVNKWEVGAKLLGDMHVEPLFQVKAWLRRKVALIRARNDIAELIADAKRHAPRYIPIAHTLASGNMLEINIADHHLGKLAWGQETGDADYDLKIAQKIWDQCVSAQLSRVSGYKFDKVLFVCGNDLLHTNSKDNETAHGTVVTTDSRYQKVHVVTRKLMVRTIEQLRQVAPVDVLMMPGNHDEDAAFCIGDSLECWFQNCPDVQVDNKPTLRKYREFGEVMLGFTHGYKGKLEDYPLIMAQEQSEMWGRTSHREIHTGDKHQRKLIELHGVAVRILPTLTATDDWHSQHGFVGNIRCSEAYVWNRKEGLIGTAVYSLPKARH
jgi:hypothetical protein